MWTGKVCVIGTSCVNNAGQPAGRGSVLDRFALVDARRKDVAAQVGGRADPADIDRRPTPLFVSPP